MLFFPQLHIRAEENRELRAQEAIERKENMDALEMLYREQILPAKKEGLCGAIYTQLSDVEDELNGLLTYDRAVCKVDPARMREIGKLLQD